ncbi:MAG: ABC transporter permease subunit [Acidimicrobiaceae bacterium]|nr:ABC transporter permease subunit [Acidimicrobiaceae bacterium]
MTWMAWRLQRSVYLFFVAVSLLLIAYAIVNGLHIEALRHQWLDQPCHGGNGFAAKYQALCQSTFTRYSNAMVTGTYVHWTAVLPTAVLGLLLGANTVAGEMDRNTVRTAWTQSITRGRWFTTKVAVGLGSLVALAIPLCVTVSWWLSASKWTPRISTNGFTYAGWMPLTTGIFAFAVTTIVGLILRRPGWTVAVGLAVMVLVAWAMQTDVRTNLVALHSTTLTITTVTKGGVTVDRPPLKMAPANAWVIFNGYVPVHRGNTIPTWSQETTWINAVNQCPSIVTSQSVYDTCVRKLGLHDVELYVPDIQYWELQLREGGLYLASTALLLGAALLLVRRTRA